MSPDHIRLPQNACALNNSSRGFAPRPSHDFQVRAPVKLPSIESTPSGPALPVSSVQVGSLTSHSPSRHLLPVGSTSCSSQSIALVPALSSRPHPLAPPPSPQSVPLVPSPLSPSSSSPSCPPKNFSRTRTRVQFNPASLRRSRGPIQSVRVFYEVSDTKYRGRFAIGPHGEISDPANRAFDTEGSTYG